MTPKQKLESLLNNEYESENGDFYKIELFNGMTNEEIAEYKKQLPNNHLPSEIEELLRFCIGFDFYGLESVRFDTYGHFGFEEMFPNSIPLTGDEFGNFWILDIDQKGNWNSVYYVCHDPAVIIKHSEDLSEFIEQIEEFIKLGNESFLDIIRKQTVIEIWNEKLGIMEKNEKEYDFKNDKINFPEMFLIVDLTNEPIKAGFPWGKSGPNAKIVRPTDKPIWIVEKRVKHSFLSRLFGGKNKKTSA